jgi:hypothetical protein
MFRDRRVLPGAHGTWVRLATTEYGRPHVRGVVQNYGEAGMRLEDPYRIEMEAGEDGVAFFLYGF